MKVSDIKVGNSYLYNNESVQVIRRIKGKQLDQRSGILLLNSHKREEHKFYLSNGETVYAKQLS